jgi:pimeloyl-ACP methyl ester carboxylesterase
MGKKQNQPVKDYTIVSEAVRQPVDHQDGAKGYFSQRVKILIPDQITENPAVFFLLGNEMPIDDQRLAGLYTIYGKRRDMIFVNAEHRGYGESITEEEDQTIPRYVDIAQALADYHDVYEIFRDQYPGPWFAVGYSYGGGLAINYAYSYPRDIRAALSSSGVTDWRFYLENYDVQVRENLGEAFYQRLIRHIGNLGACEPFHQSWQDRELIYAYVTALSQYEKYSRQFKALIGRLSCLPTKQFVGALRYIDVRFAKGAAGEYAMSNAKLTLSRQEALTGRYSWRVWRYQQCYETGVFWKSSHPGGLYRNTTEDWVKECRLLFGQEPRTLKEYEWRVRDMADQLKVPLVYVNGGKDPWKYACLPRDYEIADGAYLYFEEGFHCPDRDVPEIGRRVIAEVFRRLGR